MLRSGRSLVAVPMLVALGACASQTASADTRSAVAISVDQARHTVMPRMSIAIGRILPGAEPYVASTANGIVISYAVRAGQAVAKDAPVATIQPTQGAAVVVRTPVAATVTAALVPVGHMIKSGTPLVGLRGQRIRQARLPYSATVATHFRIGERVYLHSPLNPLGRLTTQIVTIKPSKRNDVSYAYTDLPPLPGFAPGSPVRADLILAEQSVISVPAASVALRPIGTVVFVVHDDRVHEHVIHVRFRWHQRVAVSGLAVGTRVATSALGTLHNGTRVRIRHNG